MYRGDLRRIFGIGQHTGAGHYFLFRSLKGVAMPTDSGAKSAKLAYSTFIQRTGILDWSITAPVLKVGDGSSLSARNPVSFPPVIPEFTRL